VRSGFGLGSVLGLVSTGPTVPAGYQ
jgi:hypothetical protein